jgi:hypothetical protein
MLRLSSLQSVLVPLLVVALAGIGCGGEADSDSGAVGDSIATAAPSTDILLAPLDTTGGSVRVGAMEPVTQRPGYDNQPAFTPEGDGLLWTSIRGGQSDVYRHSLGGERGAKARLTRTPESEYSPTPRPDGGLSVVRVERDGRQRLWHYSARGEPIAPLVSGADSVGYHAWLGPDRVALFVLGTPPALHVANVRTGTDTVVASRIGRSLRSVPGASAVSFVRVHRDSTTAIHRLEGNGGLRTRRLTATPGAGTGDFHAWTPGGTLLMATKQALHAWRPPDAEWRRVASLDEIEVSRLAVSPSAEWMALVTEE